MEQMLNEYDALDNPQNDGERKWPPNERFDTITEDFDNEETLMDDLYEEDL